MRRPGGRECLARPACTALHTRTSHLAAPHGPSPTAHLLPSAAGLAAVPDHVQVQARVLPESLARHASSTSLLRPARPPPAGRFGGGDWHADQYETAEEYAQRIWEEMQAHRRAQEQRARAAFTQRRRQEEARREAFRAAAEAESRRILGEQQAQDAAWRAAVAQGQAGTKRARYEANWQFFASKHPEAPIAYADVPWFLAAEGAPQEELQRVVLYGTSGPEEQRKRLRTELIRWHPDKFEARFGRRLVPADRDRVLARVVATSQALNAISAAVQQQRQQQQQQK